jgi:pyruvate/2-oxoglutarate dehydrogenase complex dihydrolipoamide acyltransferase (E2) component
MAGERGRQVSSGDIIAEIETDKATMEVEAVDEGTVGKILVAEGTEGVKVNAVIAILLEEGEDASRGIGLPAASRAGRLRRRGKPRIRAKRDAAKCRGDQQRRAARARPPTRTFPKAPRWSR